MMHRERSTLLTCNAVRSYPCFPTCTPLFIVAIRSSTLAILVMLIGCVGKLTAKGEPKASSVYGNII